MKQELQVIFLTMHADAQLAAEALRAGASGFTFRPREVISLIAEGRTMKEIAAALGLSPRTVETHKYQVMQALGLQTIADLIRYAFEHGLTPPPRQG
jgi:DNA-binding NarL/FixJ family response regulator